MPARWGAAARLPPRQALRPLPHDPCRSRRGQPAAPVRPNKPALPRLPHDRCFARQHHHRGGLPDIDMGAVVGQADRAVQPGHAGIGAGSRMPCHRRTVLPGEHPIDGAIPSIACAGSGSARPSTSAPTTAGHCGLRGDRDIVSADSGGLRRPHRSRRSAHSASRPPTCPRPTGGVGLPARVGGLSQPAPATSTSWRWIGQDRQPPRWPC